MRKRRNKRSRKKGLSAVITTLVIILLVLFTSGIVWTVIKNLVTEGSERISLGGFALDLDIKSVRVEGDDLAIGVRRNPGQADIIGIKFVFENGTDSEIIERVTDIGKLEEQNFIFGLGDLSLLGIRKVSIVPIYKSSSGKEVSGDIIDIFELEEVIRGEASWEYVSYFEKIGLVGWGTADYQVSSGGVDKLPVIERVIIDPLDVHVGDTQTFIAYVTSPNEITEVITRTQLDNEILILPLKKTENPNEYLATWQVYDTHVTTYRTNFTARDSAGNENTVPMSWTDPCTSLGDHGTTKTIDSPCPIGSGVDGIDEGNIVLSGTGSITMNGGTFIRTPGYNMTFSGGSLILQGGEVREAYIYYNDADGDGYGSGYDWSASSTYAGHVRANSATSDSDCADASGGGNENVYQNIGSLSSDNDQDGWTDTSAASRCVGGSTTISSRTYYNDTAGAYTWVNDSQKLGTSDCNDGSSSVQVNWYDDTDGDTYCQSSTLFCVANGASGYRSSCTTFTDCGDSNANVYRNVANLVADQDQDGYKNTIDPVGTKCVGADSVINGITYYVDASFNRPYYIPNAQSLGNDCCDSSDLSAGSNLTHPGQTGWFSTTQAACGWDYDCSGVSEKRWTATGGTCEGCSSEAAFRGETPDWTPLQEGDALDWIPLSDCFPLGIGLVGWTGASPACGAGSSYVSNVGNCFLNGHPPCANPALGCSTVGRTQQCH